MAQTIGRLTTLAVQRAKKPGRYPDGGGLYLQVDKKTGAKSWLFRYGPQGRRHHGLGPLRTVSLAEAREKARACRQILLEGGDPISAKRQRATAARVEAAKAISFTDAAAAYIKSHQAGWRNPKHRQQWTNTLATYVEPMLGSLPVGAVDTLLVMRVLEPIWTTKPETASRVRMRLERILDWARVRGFRSGENPARWRGHLDHLLPPQKKVARVKHHAAMPYGELPPFMYELRERPGMAARALEFAILTAARTGEVVGATWDEMDLPTRVWVVPSKRMKSGRAHRVPLSDRAVEILERLPRHGPRMFPLSNMALLALLRRMGRDVTAHGMRSSFRDWAAERTNFPRETVEAALAHVVGDQTEAAYFRSDLFERRRRLMDEWAAYLAAPAAEGADVVALRRG